METNRKVQFNVRLDEKLIKRFKELIAAKYKAFQHGLVSYETEQAIRHWLALHTHAHDDIAYKSNSFKTPNPPPRVAEVWNMVKQYLLDNYYLELKPGQQINLAHLIQAIAAVRGNDKRTIRKWLETFHRFHLVKPISGQAWEVL